VADLRRERVICVGLVGGESTGKSTLAAHLAARRGGVVATEALRDFVDRTGRPPRIDEQRGIFLEQIERTGAAVTEAHAQESGFVLSDPAPLMTAVYSAVYFADDTLTAEAAAHANETFDLLLWCRPDLPWVADGPQRDGPDERIRADELLARMLPALAVPHREVTGLGEVRTRTAIDAVEAMCPRLA
jgi:nicotinamide riboside kinase